MKDHDSGRSLIITAGDRLARALREDLNLRERDAGHAVWQTPDVRSLRQWITDVWADSWPSAQLLGETQIQALWLDAVEHDRHGVISATACAREARQAERIAQQYRVDLDDDPAYSEEQRVWRDWRRAVAARLHERDWIAPEHLPGIVAAGLLGGAIEAPALVQIAGFDAGTVPADDAVLDALRAVTTVEVFPPARPEAVLPIRGYRSTDEDAQLHFVAGQVRQHLAACSEDELPPRIVIVLPDPDARRAQLECALVEWVAPGLRSLAAGDDDTTRPRAPWRWDSAATLADSALAASLIAVTMLDVHDNPPESASRLLLGTWAADPARHAEAAAVDLALREAGTLHVGLRRIVDLAASPLRETLERLATVVEAAPRRGLPSAWSTHLIARLEAIDWPGIPTQSSSVFQQVHELRRALASLATLDSQTGPIDAARARMWLRETLKRRFEPRAEHVQPVRILAAADAAGIACDLMIVMDADASQFPGAARGTPFLPIERQRAAGVPQASPAAWLTHRRAEVATLTAAAREVILVAPKIDARGSEITPSPLFDAEWADAPPVASPSSAEQLAARGAHTVMPADDPVPPVIAPEAPRGTQSLFARFAAAPFLAFAADRLGISALPEVARGLSPSIQGTLVHAALASIWNALGEPARLRRLTPAQREALIREALMPLLRRHLPTAEFGRVLVQLEGARLTDVLGAWLAFEATREDDFSVLAHEQKVDGAIGALPVSLRIDRIERSAKDGLNSLTLVDYKTGAKVDPKGWRDDALSEPQLPLYAALFEPEDASATVGDIAFAHVADGAPALLNWQAWSGGTRPPIAHARDFAAQRAAWRGALETMAAEFLAGRADIDPESAARLRDEPLLALVGMPVDDDAADAGDGP